MKAYHINKQIWSTISSINFDVENGNVKSVLSIDEDGVVLLSSTDEELEQIAINGAIKHNVHLLS